LSSVNFSASRYNELLRYNFVYLLKSGQNKETLILIVLRQKKKKNVTSSKDYSAHTDELLTWTFRIDCSKCAYHDGALRVLSAVTFLRLFIPYPYLTISKFHCHSFNTVTATGYQL